MIKAITIENFKGISEPVRIEFKPITLLFGANSCGKSSIIQALHYLREVLEFGRLDVDKTTSGGDFIDLGGFDNFVNGHDTERQVTFTVELHHVDNITYGWDQESRRDGSFGESLREKIQEAGEILLKFSICKRNGEVCVDQMVINLNNSVVISRHFSDNHTVEINYINTPIPIVGVNSKSFDQLFLKIFGVPDSDLKQGYWYPIEGSDQERFIQKRIFEPWKNLLPGYGYASFFTVWDDEADRIEEYAFDYAKRGVVGTIVDELRNLLYVGPLRSIPQRNYAPQKTFASSRWADGLAAWDKASYADDKKIVQVNRWLGEDRLDTGYKLTAKTTVSAEHPAFEKLATAPRLSFKERQALLENIPKERKVQLIQVKGEIEVSLCDVGVGISQSFPVVMAALDETAETIIIEQPELHIHPRLQVELGDLFIAAANSGKCMIVETHSEHLLLRIMKRMRKYETSLDTKCDLTAQANSELKVTPEDVGVWFMEPHNGITIAREMTLNKRGEFVKSWPGGFFEEGLRETF
ncbi:MAG: AAA family ATPase [Chlorobium sp.]